MKILGCFTKHENLDCREKIFKNAIEQKIVIETKALLLILIYHIFCCRMVLLERHKNGLGAHCIINLLYSDYYSSLPYVFKENIQLRITHTSNHLFINHPET